MRPADVLYGSIGQRPSSLHSDPEGPRAGRRRGLDLRNRVQRAAAALRASILMKGRQAARHRTFIAVSLADLLAGALLAAAGLPGGIWLLNLPATISVGRLASLAGGDGAGLLVTATAGAALYGWAAEKLARPVEGEFARRAA